MTAKELWEEINYTALTNALDDIKAYATPDLERKVPHWRDSLVGAKSKLDAYAGYVNKLFTKGVMALGTDDLKAPILIIPASFVPVISFNSDFKRSSDMPILGPYMAGEFDGDAGKALVVVDPMLTNEIYYADIDASKAVKFIIE